jgi:hypothetical protein
LYTRAGNRKRKEEGGRERRKEEEGRGRERRRMTMLEYMVK